jgi:hypothetical protein
VSASIGCGPLPGRKRKALWVEHNGRITPLAYFTSESTYAAFLMLEAAVTRAALDAVAPRLDAIYAEISA